jgi:hypothetical protein
MTWTPLLPVRMRQNPLWVSATQAQNAPWLCPEGTAATMRGLWLTDYGWKNRMEPWPKLPFLLRDAVTEIGMGADPDTVIDGLVQQHDDPPIHPGLVRYLRHALGTYVATNETLAEQTPGLRHTPPREAFYDNDTVKAWAIYLDDGNGLREARRLRQTHTREPDPQTLAWAGVAAYTLVHGTRTGVEPDPPPTRIRVVEVGLDIEDDIVVVFDGTPDEALGLFHDQASPRLFRLAGGTTRRPGRSCSSCRYLGGCDTLPRANGVLGVPSNGVCTRSVSASTLTSYRWCPAQHFLRDLAYVPRDRDADAPSIEQTRGDAVHRWLEAAHNRHEPCTVDDLPDPELAGPAVEDGALGLGPLEPYEYAHAWPLLRRHVAVCALQYDHVEGPIEVEVLRRFFDADADAVVVAKPDLTYVAGERPVWREVKTTGHLPPADEHEIVDSSLAAALYLALLADGAASADGETPGVLEWEVLTTADDDAHLYYLETDNEPLVALARQKLAETAIRWHTDVTFAPAPQSWKCDRCPVQRWCPSAGATPLPGTVDVAWHDLPEVDDLDDEPPPF